MAISSDIDSAGECFDCYLMQTVVYVCVYDVVRCEVKRRAYGLCYLRRETINIMLRYGGSLLPKVEPAIVSGTESNLPSLL